MTTLREAAQQALEALELARDYAEGERLENERRYKGHEHLAPDDAYAVGQIDNAITALRGALAEQVQPTYWGVFEGGNLHDFFTVRETAEEMAYYKGSHAVVGPIYTTPPAPVVPQPLTDFEILDVYTKWDSTPGSSWADYARAVEAEVLKRIRVQR